MPRDNKSGHPAPIPGLDVSRSASPAALSLHNNFKNSVAAFKRDLVRCIHYLAAIRTHKVHLSLGYRSIYDYAEWEAGFTRGQTKAFLNLGRQLNDYPELKRALGNGDISWTKATQIVRKADPANEREWIDLARTMTTRQLAKHKPVTIPHNDEPNTEKPQGAEAKPSKPARPMGRIPGPPTPKPADTICHVTFMLKPEDYSRWEKLNAALKAKHPRETKEGLMLRGLAGLVDNGTRESSSSHLVVIHECPACGTATQTNARGEFEVDGPLLGSASCDATVQTPDGARRATIPPKLRRQVLARDRHGCQAPDCRHGGFLQVHHRVPRAQGGTTTLDNLVTLCAACHRRLHEREGLLEAAKRDPLG